MLVRKAFPPGTSSCLFGEYRFHLLPARLPRLALSSQPAYLSVFPALHSMSSLPLSLSQLPVRAPLLVFFLLVSHGGVSCFLTFFCHASWL